MVPRVAVTYREEAYKAEYIEKRVRRGGAEGMRRDLEEGRFRHAPREAMEMVEKIDWSKVEDPERVVCFPFHRGDRLEVSLTFFGERGRERERRVFISVKLTDWFRSFVRSSHRSGRSTPKDLVPTRRFGITGINPRLISLGKTYFDLVRSFALLCSLRKRQSSSLSHLMSESRGRVEIRKAFG